MVSITFKKSWLLVIIPLFSFFIDKLFLAFHGAPYLITILFLYVFGINTTPTFLVKYHKQDIKIVLVALIYLIIYYIIQQDHTGMGSIINGILFAITPLIFYQLTLHDRNFSNIRNLLLLFLMTYTLWDKDNDLINTNTIGLIFLSTGLYLNILLPPNTKLFLLVNSLVIGEIWLSESRTCLIVYLLYLFSLKIPVKTIIKRRVYYSICLLLTLGSLLYVLLYIYLYQHNIDLTSSFSGISNKSFFSGRQRIWIESLDLLYKYPWTGVGSKLELSSFDFFYLHNSVLQLFVVYGIPFGTIILTIYLRVLFFLRPYINDVIVKKCVFVFWAYLLIGFTEVMLFDFIMTLSLFLAYSRINNTKLRYNYKCN